MPELAKIGPPGGIDVPGAVQVPRQGAALEEFRRVSEETGRMGALVMSGIRRLQVENGLASAGAMANQAYLINNAEQSRNAKYLNNPDMTSAMREWVKDRATATDKINQGLLAQHKDIAPELRPYLQRLAQEHSYVSSQRFMTDYEQNIRDQFAGPTTTAVVNDIVNTDDPDKAMQKQVLHEAAIMRAPGFRPAERDNLLASFQHEVALRQGIKMATTSAPGQINAYLKDHPELSPEDGIKLRAASIEAVNQPLREMDAQHNLVKAQTYAKYEQQLKSGNLDVAAMTRDVEANRLPLADAEYLAHRRLKIGLPADPEGVKSAIAEADGLNSAEEVKEFRQARVTNNPYLNEPDKGEIEAALTKRDAYLKTTIGKAEVSGSMLLGSAYAPPHGFSDPNYLAETMYGGSRGRNSATTEAAYEQAKRAYKLETIGETDPAKFRAAALRAIAENPRAQMEKPKEAPTGPPPPPPPVTPSVAHRLADWFHTGVMPRGATPAEAGTVLGGHKTNVVGPEPAAAPAAAPTPGEAAPAAEGGD